MNSILMRAWDAFKVSAGKFIRDSFLKTNLPPFITTALTTNTHAYAESVQVSSGYKSEEINKISCCTAVHIEAQGTRTDDPMVVLREKVSKQSSRDIVLRYAAHDAVME